MKDRPIIVIDADMNRLTRLVRALKNSLFRDQQQLELLDQTLENAEVRPQARVPSNVITMNSSVRVRDFIRVKRNRIRWCFPRRRISRGA